MDDAIEESVAILRAARNLRPGEENDFGYFSNDSLVKQFNEFTLYLRLGFRVIRETDPYSLMEWRRECTNSTFGDT